MKIDAALQYLNHGWSVIPLRPNSKVPAVQWAAYQIQRATPDEVRQWWTQWPDANIGLITGAISGVIAVDVDPRHGGNAEPIHHANNTGLIQRTAGGGTHLIYSYPGGVDWIPCRTSVEPGIDIRADGGYIVVAPSEIDGRPYTWLGKVTDIGRNPPRWAVARDPEARGEIVDKWLSIALQGVQEGERNDTMARIVGYMAAKEIPKDVSLEFIRLWNGKNANPHTLTQTEIEATINSVYRRARTNKKKPVNGTSKDHDFALLDLRTYATKYESTSVTWQIDDWLPASTIGFAISPPGAFKTWLLLDAAVSIASGKAFLGKWPIHDPGPVVIVQQEDHHAAIVSRVNTIVWSKYDMRPVTNTSDEFEFPSPPQLPIYVHSNRALRFDDADVVASFVRSMRKIKPKMVFIDPLYTAVSSDNYMAEAAERMLVLKALRDELGTTFVMAHHTKKSGSTSDITTDRMDAWGSQFLNAFLETGWQIRSTSRANIIKILRHFKTTGVHQEICLKWNIDDDSYQYEVEEIEPNSIDAAAGANEQRILDALAKEPMSGRALTSVLSMHPNIVKKMIAKLEEQGSIIRDEATNKWALTEPIDLSQLKLSNESLDTL